MGWRKLGHVYAPDGSQWWARRYAHLPTAEVLDDETIRIYFAGLDENKYGRVGYVDVDAANPTRVLRKSDEPVLDIGGLGTFEDSGVNPSCVVRVNNQRYFYYIGWQRCERVPYMLYAGLAIGDGDQWHKYAAVPVLDRTPREPYLRSATTVIVDEGQFRCWYVSGIDWTTVRGALYPTYVIRYADSQDGIHWNDHDHICINFKDDDEFGFGRPWVIKDNDRYKMWYSIRSRSRPYCIGYAESADGLTWTRLDHLVGINASESGWDSEMVCYPCIVDVGSRRYMFYNGNQHGATGFGAAIWES